MAEQKRKKKSWGGFLLGWFAFLLAVGALICFLFYRYASVYEDTKPSVAVDALLEDMSADDWLQTLDRTLPEGSRFEDIHALFASYFDSVIRPTALSYRQDLSVDGRGEAAFTVYAGRNKIAVVKLRPKPDTDVGFGRSQWEVESIQAYDFRKYLDSVTVEIVAPADQAVSLNGLALGEGEIVDRAVTPPQATELERRFTESLRYLRYRVPGLYGEITVTDAAGDELAPEPEQEDGLCLYVLDPGGSYAFAVEAPEDVAVTVNGLTLTAQDGQASAMDLFAQLDTYTGGQGYRMRRYSAEGLYTLPQISAVDSSGQALTPVVSEGVWYFFYEDDSGVPDEAKQAAEDFFNAYMKYSSTSFNNAAMNQLLEKILPGTQLYRYVKESADAMYWASATEVSYQELRFDHFYAVSDKCVSCTIAYQADFKATSWYEQYSYDLSNGYQLVLVEKDGSWLAAVQSAFGG